MNYLRGAVSAISAPYQYYKDINPSTLTGAIDVIVIRRPKLAESNNADTEPAASPDGEKELACSPFHVRFGKWQVLRPTDKKVCDNHDYIVPLTPIYICQVDIFVNGNLIPFSMKIGEAGEAFFVFETDEDVPEDIVTSPLLEATKPGEVNAGERPTDRFGAKATQDGSQATTENLTSNLQEPEFLDLNADASESVPPEETRVDALSQDHASEYSKDNTASPSIVSRTAELGKAALGVVHEVEKNEKDKLKDKGVKDALIEAHEESRTYVKDGLKAARNFSPSRYIGSQLGDEVLPRVPDEDVTPEVHYGHGMFTV